MKIIYRLSVILVFLIVLATIIAFARGYRFDFSQKSFTSTGILSINSYPKAAKVYVNNQFKGVTDINLSLPPGKYQIDIKKDGYTSWSKNIILKGELVETLDALLFPTNPSLSPLTNLGVVKVIPVDQTDKIILFSENNFEEKDGIYIFESSKKPLSFLPPLKLIILKKNLPTEVEFKKTEIYFSPDFKQAVFDFNNFAYLLSLDGENIQPFDITNSKDTLLTAWVEEKEKETIKILETYPKEIRKIATSSCQVISFSPDETKVLYQAKKYIDLPFVITPILIGTNQTPDERSLKKDVLYIYDKKEDKNYVITNNQLLTLNQTPFSILNSQFPILWYPDSKHLINNETKRISVIDYDNTNRQTIYSGPFENYFFSTTTDGKIVILANLNPEANKLPDLYLVGIK